ncbi:MAG: DNA mismatch endonuclease Vsr [Chthoniobacterales bacterium]
MGDNLSRSRRSWNMARIRSRDTKPEMSVRSMLHRLGYRFRLHRRELPGRPDVVLSSRKCVVLVHGCFWHQHRGCVDCSRPGTNSEYWTAKLKGNVARDRRNIGALRRDGWTVITVWECETRNLDTLSARMKEKIPKRRVVPSIRA